MTNDLVALKNFILDTYNLGELRTLCFNLGINYEEFREGGISIKVNELLLLTGNAQQFRPLIEELRRNRPQKFKNDGLSTSDAFINQLYAQLPSIKQQKERPRDEHILINRVKTFWIEGVLENSLHSEASIEIGKEYRPESVEYPWKMIIRRPGSNRQIFPEDKTILDAFDESNESLLILGKPGSGKTTMLLELAKNLIIRAEQDSTLPIPTIFNLSSWKDTSKSISDWIIDELNGKYKIPKKISRQWVDDDKLLLLLDGLDEIKSGIREGCIKSINAYRKKFGTTSIIICSRVADYNVMSTRLKLDTAIVLQPLTSSQIDTYLNGTGLNLRAVRETLKRDLILRQLAESPLMLSVMAIAYEGKTVGEIKTFHTVQTRRKHIIDTYVQKMFERRPIVHPYSENNTIHWLTWLSQKMVQQNLSTFLIEYMQPTWLKNIYQKHLYLLISIIVTGLLFALAGGGIGMVIESFGANNFGFFDGFGFGLLIGLWLGKISGQSQIEPVEALKWSYKKTKSGLINGFITGLTLGLCAGITPGVGLSDWLRVGAVFGLLGGLFWGLYSGFDSTIIEEKITPNQGIRQSINNAFKVMLLIGLFGGLVLGLINWLNSIFIDNYTVSSDDIIHIWIIGGISLGIFGGYFMGGADSIQHFILRFILYSANYFPRNNVQFLDYATERIFLRKVGGGYMFIHRMFIEYFARLESEM